MNYKVDIDEDALEEIKDAFRYIYADSRRQAERWLQGLYKAIDSLEQMPSRCGLARENEHLKEEVRQLVYKSHRIIFIVREDTVEVLHVRHSAMRMLDPE